MMETDVKFKCYMKKMKGS